MKKKVFSIPMKLITKQPKATDFEWYVLDINDEWILYGDTETSGNIHFTPNITSNDIEKEFITNRHSIFKFESRKFEYELDFSKMIQRNIQTGKVRRVQRRPKQITNGHPPHWDPMKKSDIMILSVLTPSQNEYNKIQSLLTAEVADTIVISIKRIQNPFLWRALDNKTEELRQKYGTSHELNIQKLFHGTKSDIIDKICKENFDWRLHGSRVGQLYGQGTYFSNSAAYSHAYSPCDSSGHRFMMVARVIVGYTTKGDPSMARPPLNPATGMLYDTTVDNEMNPKIFVKYDKQEYYPEYIIEYEIKKSEHKVTVNNITSVPIPSSSSSPPAPISSPHNSAFQNIVINSRVTTHQPPSSPTTTTTSPPQTSNTAAQPTRSTSFRLRHPKLVTGCRKCFLWIIYLCFCSLLGFGIALVLRI